MKSGARLEMKHIAMALASLALLVSCTSDPPEAATVQATGGTVDARLEQLGVQLREPPAPTANYVTAVRSGSLVYLAGHGPDRPEGGQVLGKLGPGGLTVEEGQEAARLAGIALLSSLRAEVGDLDLVTRIVKVQGMINADPSFTEHSQVMNGFSDLMVEVFGERGKHARASVGMSSLPNDIAVEIDMIVEVAE
jgi:enamine deaminase RidA (YjgF/YER057c/UK114 family)